MTAVEDDMKKYLAYFALEYALNGYFRDQWYTAMAYPVYRAMKKAESKAMYADIKERAAARELEEEVAAEIEELEETSADTF